MLPSLVPRKWQILGGAGTGVPSDRPPKTRRSASRVPRQRLARSAAVGLSVRPGIHRVRCPWHPRRGIKGGPEKDFPDPFIYQSCEAPTSGDRGSPLRDPRARCRPEGWRFSCSPSGPISRSNRRDGVSSHTEDKSPDRKLWRHRHAERDR